MEVLNRSTPSPLPPVAVSLPTLVSAAAVGGPVGPPLAVQPGPCEALRLLETVAAECSACSNRHPCCAEGTEETQKVSRRVTQYVESFTVIKIVDLAIVQTLFLQLQETIDMQICNFGRDK